MKAILLVAAIFITSITFGQTHKEKGIPEEGTYQIIVKDSKIKWVFTNSVLEGMEEKRMKNESFSVEIADNIFLYLPSKKTIKSSDFEKLEGILYE